MSSQIRVGLVDGDLEMRAGRRLMLDATRETTVVFEENSVNTVLEKFDDYLIDVLVVDQRLRSMSGTDLIAALTRIKLKTGNLTKLLLTAPYGSKKLTIAALQAGASAVITQDEPSKSLIERIKRLHAGESQFSLEYMRDALIELNIATRPDHVFEAFLESLLPDTREILQLVIHGETIQSIAKTKDIAAYRARKVVETALEQLQICTLEQLQLRYLNLELNA
jgi:DNA-binding NarL/FixJ family response regulator